MCSYKYIYTDISNFRMCQSTKRVECDFGIVDRYKQYNILL